MRRRFVTAILIIGIGLVAAPAVFQMFTRAPKGGEMINEFRPFMAPSKVNQFQGYMAQIDDVHVETSEALPALAEQHGIGDFASRYPSTAAFNEQWPGIFEDMNNDMLATMEEMIDNFAAVAALPPFPLFPWFFVAPGLMIAAGAWSALRADGKGKASRTKLRFLVIMGIGLIAAPAIFQMFTRAPKGAEMINEFEPLMTSDRLLTIQGYFLVIGAAEGELRNQVEPDLGLSPAEVTQQFPVLDGFHQEWGTISSNMAPMIGAMADNIDNYLAVRALPPFTLFPWFFVLPGVLVAGLALRAQGSASSIGGREAFAASMPPPADSTGAFFEGLKEKAEARKDALRVEDTGGVPATPPGLRKEEVTD